AVMNHTWQDDQKPQSSLFITQHRLHEVKVRSQTRILVADDHRVNQQLAVLMLERLGFRADIVANGNEAVEAVSRVPYSLVFMDCQMPEMDGYQATREIRNRAVSGKIPDSKDNNGRTLRLPIIAMTANAMQGDREKCLEAGMDDYLSKPIKSDQLQLILSKWLSSQEP
ncbi:MAG: response regulator, partial [Nitrospirales bacterium]